MVKDIDGNEVDEGRQVLCALLSALGLDAGMDCYHECARLGVTAKTFADPKQGIVFACAEQLLREGTACDGMTVAHSLSLGPHGIDFQPAGALKYIERILDCGSSVCTLAHYAGRLRAREICRGAMDVMNKAKNLFTSYTFSNKGEAEHWIDNLSKELISLSGGAQGGTDWKSSIATSNQALASLVTTGRDGRQGVLTGYRWIDRLVDGYKPATLNVIAARPSVGKSALALNIAENVARAGRPVLFLSLEMDAESLARRLLAKLALLDLDQIRDAYEKQLMAPATRADCLNRLDAARKDLDALPLVVEDACPREVTSVEMCVRRHLARNPDIALIVVDYLQLVHSRGHGSDRTSEIGAISSALKQLSKDLRRPFLVLSQLSRASVSESRQPQLSDLRGSGEIEQDADTVLLLSRETEAPEAGDRGESRPICANLAKNRNGRVGKTTMEFVGKWALFREDAKLPHPKPKNVSRLHDDDIM